MLDISTHYPYNASHSEVIPSKRQEPRAAGNRCRSGEAFFENSIGTVNPSRANC